MPHYEIFHTCPLNGQQQSSLAEAITALHCSTFSAPSIFVNITFHYYGPGDTNRGTSYGRTMFVGGKQASTNYIIGHLRPRGANNRPKLNELTETITTLWNDTVGPKNPGWLSDKHALHNVFIMEDITAGAEQGFVLPIAGQDAEWAEKNGKVFRERAAAGDKSMEALVQEVEAGLGSKL